TFLDDLTIRIEDRPLRATLGLAAGARDELESYRSSRMRDRHLGQLARLDGHIGADDGVRVAIAADDMEDARIEPHDKSRPGTAHDALTIAELVGLTGKDVV